MMSSSDFSIPQVPPDSPGSSVSTRLQEEYDELLKYAVVVPTFDPETNLQDGSKAKDRDSQSTPIFSEPKTTLFPHPPSPITLVGQKDISGSHPTLCKNTTNRDNSDIEYEETVYTTTIDHDVGKMDSLMDQWCLDMKRNVLAEFSQSKIRIIEHCKKQVQKDKENFASEKNQMVNELESMKELLHTYEQSIERKDQVISNLTHALQKQKEKCSMTKQFSEWKNRHSDRKRESFTSNLAAKHYERTLTQRVWCAWHSIIESKWRQRVEKACQAKAQEVCMQLTNDYEAKIASLNESLSSMRSQVQRLHQEREHYEEAMKKAFMRGVCALNLEAMNMFHNEEEDTTQKVEFIEKGGENAGNLQESLPDKQTWSKNMPSEEAHSAISGDFTSRVVTSQNSRPFTSTTSHTKQTKPCSTKTKTVSAKISAKSDSTVRSHILSGTAGANQPGLAPPMSSVIVERHQPVVKQTVGKATASKYPRSQSAGASQKSGSGITHRKIAGQAGVLTITPNMQSIKVVD